jgi:hypothetical protein
VPARGSPGRAGVASFDRVEVRGEYRRTFGHGGLFGAPRSAGCLGLVLTRPRCRPRSRYVALRCIGGNSPVSPQRPVRRGHPSVRPKGSPSRDLCVPAARDACARRRDGATIASSHQEEHDERRIRNRPRRAARPGPSLPVPSPATSTPADALKVLTHLEDVPGLRAFVLANLQSYLRGRVGDFVLARGPCKGRP